MFQTPRILGLQARAYRVNGMNKFYFGYKDQNDIETCLEAGVKSEHYDLAFSEENSNSTFTSPETGEVFLGKGSVPAEKVYAIAMRKRADDAAKLANKAALAANVSETPAKPDFPVAC